MGIMTLQINLNGQRMIDLGLIRKARGIPSEKGQPGYISDDRLAGKLLFERIDELLRKESNPEDP